MDTPNFRLQFTSRDDGSVTHTTLQEFLRDNEGAPGVCARVAILQPGQAVELPTGVVHRTEVTPPRYAHFRVPIRFDGAREATVTVDRQRLNLIIRPFRRRQVVILDLQAVAERYLMQDAKIRAQERLKARKARRLARRQS